MKSIIDNQGENTLLSALGNVFTGGDELSIATAFFSLDALNLIGKSIGDKTTIRILFGGDASPAQRLQLLELMRSRSDEDLAKSRIQDPTVDGLQIIKRLIDEGRLEARVYTKDKFHAKAYLTKREAFPPYLGIIGSGNFTRAGLTQNIELNVHLQQDQTAQLKVWYDDCWNLAANDDITVDLNEEILRHITFVEPHAIYLKSLLAWGDFQQGRSTTGDSEIQKMLDPHQILGFNQSIRILERENGVMVCDGVGLGKSFIALALMEHYLNLGKRVLLVAPKTILQFSWEYYINEYLSGFREPFGQLYWKPMTFFGFDPKKTLDETNRMLEALAEQADVVVIDESHNFRTTNSLRYDNLKKITNANHIGKKQIILLTATPINTHYSDISAQFALITNDNGTIAGHPIASIRSVTSRLDKEDPFRSGIQANLFDSKSLPINQKPLRDALESIVIQRSRNTCRELARAAGVEVRFPERERPQEVIYELSPFYEEVIRKAKNDFKELARFLEAYKREIRRVADASRDKPTQLQIPLLPMRGLKFSGYLPESYRFHGRETNREAQVEAFLASLVFVNVMKQLESSVVAFQGILQSLAAGLCARLQVVFEEGVADVITEHQGWINTNLFDLNSENEIEDAEDADLSGEEMDDWIDRAINSRSVRKALADFGPETHDVKKWRKDILQDLDHLRDIHEVTVNARKIAEDQKLTTIAQKIKEQRQRGRKVLVFTQSKRTAFYLEKELDALVGERVERIDSSVQGITRQRYLHEFSPTYNPAPDPTREYDSLNVLVCTDVLSEGVNLQEAGCILNYDIHWNPVRLIQRIGRVDRRLKEGTPDHSFSILNVFPPKLIEDIINLVGTVEDRRYKISQTMGIDTAFFNSEDEEGTLKEFNAQVDGTITDKDKATAEYIRATRLSEGELARANAVPPAGLGVWENAPQDGLFALFTVELTTKATEQTTSKFEKLVGKPILALITENDCEFDAPTILELLAQTKIGEQSGIPQNPNILTQQIKKLKERAKLTLRDIGLAQGVDLKLECWLELKSK